MDKTNVKQPVPGSGEDQDESRSQTGDEAGLKSPDKQSWENQAKEYKRKYEDLSDKYEGLSEEISDLKEKISSGDGTRADRDKLERLRDKRDEVQAKKDAILSNPDAKPWLEIVEERTDSKSKSTAENAVYEYDYRQALKTVTKEAKSRGVEEKEFREELFDILKGGRWEFDREGNRIMPTERVEFAIAEWERISELKQKASKKEEPPYAERGGKSTERAKTRIDDIHSARESGSWRDLLAKKANVQKEHFK